MSILRTRSNPCYRCFLVRPIGEFRPSNWRQRPQRFEIMQSLCQTNRIGKADADRFLHNRQAIADGTANKLWFITLK